MITQHRAQRHFFGQSLAQLKFGEHRCLVQPAAQVHREQAEHAAEQERDPPGVIRHFSGRINAVDRRGDQRAEEDAGSQTAGERAAGITDVLLRYVFGNEDPRPRHFTANRCALDHPHQQQQDRRPDADLRVSRQQAHDQRRHGHHENAQGEHLLAPQQVTEVRHDDAAQRPRQIAGGEDAERLHQAQPLWHVGREEQLADDGGEEHEDDEIVELQRPAEGGQRQSLVVIAGQRSCGLLGLREARRRCGHGKGFSYSRICRHNNAGGGLDRFGTIANCSKKHIEARN